MKPNPPVIGQKDRDDALRSTLVRQVMEQFNSRVIDIRPERPGASE